MAYARAQLGQIPQLEIYGDDPNELQRLLLITKGVFCQDFANLSWC